MSVEGAKEIIRAKHQQSKIPGMDSPLIDDM